MPRATGCPTGARDTGILSTTQSKTHLNHLADTGHAAARDLFHDAGHHLALAVSNLAQTLDPDTITISGEGVDVWHHWEAGFLTTLRHRLPHDRRDLPVTIHPWDDDTWAHGAASLVFALPPLSARTSSQALGPVLRTRPWGTGAGALRAPRGDCVG